MKLEGKKINFLGDSITWGVGTGGEEHTFWSVLGARTGATVRGYGISGTRIARQHNCQWDQDNQHYVARVDTMDADADVVVIFGGTNDWGHGDAPIGRPEDREDTTFYGAMHALCRKLIERYPTAVIVFMTPLHRVGDDRPQYNDVGMRLDVTLEEYSRIITEVANYYALPVMDARHISGMQPEIESNRARYMPDGLHPNDAGHLLLADRLQAFLESL